MGGITAAVVLGTCILVFGFLRKINELYHVMKYRLGKKQINSLPPGDMGWPVIGNLLSFIRAFKSQDPESFINKLKKRYGETCIYKDPCIIVCRPDLCRKVLTDDEQFKSGYPFPSLILGGKPFDFVSSSGHKRFRRLTTSRINGHESLSTCMGSIEEIVINSLEEWTKTNEPIQFFSEMNKVAFKVIMTIFLDTASDDSVIASMEKYCTCLFHGLFCTAVNIPGFAFHRAVKARKILVKTFQAVLAESRERESNDPNTNRGLIDLIKGVEDEEGEKLDDEHIIIVLLVFLLAGHETSGRAATWATIYLHDHLLVLQKAKEEQVEIIKRRPSSQKGLTVNEIKQMKYLSKATSYQKDGKCWSGVVQFTWMLKLIPTQNSSFLQDRMILNPKQGLSNPFGAGSRTCPGADLAKLEISIFFHYFLLNYKLEQLNPGGHVNYLPEPDPADSCLAKFIKLH